MPCKSCASVNLGADMAIHFPGVKNKNIDKLVVRVFSELVVCLDCSNSELALPEAKLRQLARGDAAAAS